MTTYVRPAASARDDADMIVGWNISPNTGYTLQLSVTSSGAVVLLLSADGSTLIGSGTTSIGAAQPVTITPVSGRAVDMADPSLGWHLLLTTDGTEGERSITMDPIVDLPARTHPVYADDGLSLSVATADINAGTHYTQDVVASCPLGFGASVGDTASVPVDGSAVVGQVESVTWTGTPDGSTAQSVIRAHIPIRPDAYTPPVVPTPPTVVDDAGTTDAATTTSGNVLTNDSGGTLTVSAVNGISSNVGATVAGSSGGDFVISADGSWTFDPSGDFAALSGAETADTSVTYHASDGVSESMGVLTVTVSAAGGSMEWTPAEISTALWLDAADSSTLTLNGSNVSQWADKSGRGNHAVNATAASQPTYMANSFNGLPALWFDITDDFLGISSPNGLSSVTDFFYAAVFQMAPSNGSWRMVMGGRTSFNSYVSPKSGMPLLQKMSTSNQFGMHDADKSDTRIKVDVTDFAAKSIVTIGRSGGSTGPWPVTVTATGHSQANYLTTQNQTWGSYKNNVFQIGGRQQSSTGYFDGLICECIAMDYNPTTEERQKIEGYLAHKWGLAANLPSDHPYKSAAPTI